MKWKGKLVNNVIEQLQDDSAWGNTIEKMLINSSVGIHLAVCNEPFLSLLLNGEKKIESRFSINKISPYLKIMKGDIVILKASGGLVSGAFVSGNVTYFQTLTKKVLKEIEIKYGNEICSRYDKCFWSSRNKANYATLIEVKKVKSLIPFKSHKKDRTGWTILRNGISNSLFEKSV